MMKLGQGKPGMWIAAATIAGIGLGGLVYCYTRSIQGGDPGDRLWGAVDLVPNQALMAGYVSTRPEPWQGDTGSAALAPLQGALAQWESQWLTPRNLSYDQDIQPWLDGVMVSILPPTAVRQEGQLNLLLLLGVRDPLKAKALVGKLEGQPGTTVSREEYQGVEVTTWSQGDLTLYSALLGSYVAVSPERQSVERAIETAQGADSLRDQPGAAEALRGSLTLENPTLQMYIPDYGGLINQLLVASPQAAPLPPDSLAQLEQFSGLTVGLEVTPEGLHVQGVVKVDPETETLAFEPATGDLLDYLPGGTTALLSGRNLGSLWQAYQEQATANPQLKVGFDNLRQRFQEFGLDPDQDLFRWMTGEFALATLPTTSGILKQLGFGVALVLDSSDRPTTEQTLDKLDRLAERSNLQVQESTTAGGQPLVQWILPQGFFQNEVLLGHGWLDGDSVFVALGGGTVEALTTLPDSSLAQDPIFKATTAPLPDQNSGYFYVNVASGLGQLQGSPLLGAMAQLPEGAEGTVNLLQSVAMTTTQRDRHTNQVDAFVVLSSGSPPATPAPAPSAAPSIAPSIAPSP